MDSIETLSTCTCRKGANQGPKYSNNTSDLDLMCGHDLRTQMTEDQKLTH